jgi:hypothetical protein
MLPKATPARYAAALVLRRHASIVKAVGRHLEQQASA